MQNVLVIGKFSTEAFGLHIAETLLEMGYGVFRFTPGVNAPQGGGVLRHRINQARRVIWQAFDSVPKFRSKHIEGLWKLVKNQQIDYVIVCHDFLQPAEVAKLKQITNAKIALWFPDALVNFHKGYFMNACYDALFFKDPFIKYTLMEVLRSPVYYLPEAFNPTLHNLPEGTKIDDQYLCDITTAGNAHSWRVAFYQHLANYEVKVWGPPAPIWMSKDNVAKMFQNKMVYNSEKAKAFLGAKIVLNNLHYGEIWGLNVRTFEAAGIGAFQMVNWRPGLEQLFRDGEEIVSFNSVTDLHAKIDYWIKNPDQRATIAKAGKDRAYKEHTYQHRLQLLLATLDGLANGFPLPEIKVT